MKSVSVKESRKVMKDCGMGLEGKGKMKIPRGSHGVRKGFILITVLAVLLVIALGAATVLQSVGSQANLKAKSLKEAKSQYLAEAGMQYALWKCRTSSCTAGTIIDPLDGLATETIVIDATSVIIKYPVLPAPATAQLFAVQVSVNYADV